MFTTQINTFALIACVCLLLDSCTSESIFGIGTRIEGDELLLKDELEARALGLEESPTIIFNYAIPEPITYIEIRSLENVYADVHFSYDNDLVNGSITAANGFVSNDNSTNDHENSPSSTIASPVSLPPFNVEISVYGYRDNASIVNAIVLNRDQQFTGWLKPTKDDIDEESDEYLNMSEELLQYDVVDNNAKRHPTDDFEDDVDDEVATKNGIHDDDDSNDDDAGDEFNNADKIIELGQRQKGDYLIYETYQTSPTATQTPSTHSVVFYYIDSNYITYVRFVIFDHASGRGADDYNPPVAEYTHFTPRSLKAVITNDKTTNLFVQMFLYGYNKTDKPVDYKPFLGSDNAASRAIRKTQGYFTVGLLTLMLLGWSQ